MLGVSASLLRELEEHPVNSMLVDQAKNILAELLYQRADRLLAEEMTRKYAALQRLNEMENAAYNPWWNPKPNPTPIPFINPTQIDPAHIEKLKDIPEESWSRYLQMIQAASASYALSQQMSQMGLPPWFMFPFWNQQPQNNDQGMGKVLELVNTLLSKLTEKLGKGENSEELEKLREEIDKIREDSHRRELDHLRDLYTLQQKYMEQSLKKEIEDLKRQIKSPEDLINELEKYRNLMEKFGILKVDEEEKKFKRVKELIEETRKVIGRPLEKVSEAVAEGIKEGLRERRKRESALKDMKEVARKIQEIRQAAMKKEIKTKLKEKLESLPSTNSIFEAGW